METSVSGQAGGDSQSVGDIFNPKFRDPPSNLTMDAPFFSDKETLDWQMVNEFKEIKANNIDFWPTLWS